MVWFLATYKGGEKEPMESTKEEVGVDKRVSLKTTKKFVFPDSDLILQGHCMVLYEPPEGFKV